MKFCSSLLLTLIASFALSGCEKPKAVLQDKEDRHTHAERIALPNLSFKENETIELLPEQPVEVVVEGVLYDGYELNLSAPSSFMVSLSEGSRQTDAARHPIRQERIYTPTISALVEPLPSVTEGSVVLEASYYYCRKTEQAVCLVKSFSFWQPYKITSSALLPPALPEPKLVQFQAELTPEAE